MKIENIADLKVLVHTARTGSLTGAASVLGITPAAASATLKRLESQLGTRLFERSTRAMRLTAHGQTLLDYANRAFELVAEGEALVTDDRTRLVGTIRISAPSSLARTILMPWLNEFLQMHPGVHLALSVGDRTQDVVKDEVDVAIRYGELADSRLVARTLALTRPIVCAAPSYLARHAAPITPPDLLDHNCLVFGRGGRNYQLWKFAQNGVWSQVRVNGDRSVDDASLAHDWAVAGAGVLLKTPIELTKDLAAGTLVRVMANWETEPYPLYAVLPSGKFVPQRVRSFVDFLTNKFAHLGTVTASSSAI